MNRELITNAWSKKDTQKAPNITQFFNNFNRNAYNFCWFILNLSQPEERARGLEYLIEIAQHCVLLGNFSTFMQLMSAIEHTSISRLKNSWQFISKHVSFKKFICMYVHGYCPLFRSKQLYHMNRIMFIYHFVCPQYN